MDPNVIRDKLRLKLKEKGWTISQAERYGGLGPTALRYFISGRTNNPKLETILAFAKVLEIEPYELIGDVTETLEQNKDIPWNEEILLKLVKILGDLFKEKEKVLTNGEVYPILMELYHNLSAKEVSQIDKDFVKIFFKKAFKEIL